MLANKVAVHTNSMATATRYQAKFTIMWSSRRVAINACTTLLVSLIYILKNILSHRMQLTGISQVCTIVCFLHFNIVA